MRAWLANRPGADGVPVVDNIVSRGRDSCDGGSGMLADTRADSPDRHARAVPDLHEPSQRETERSVCCSPLEDAQRQASTWTAVI